MEGNATIASLPPELREAFALCGITQDKQLAAIHPQALLRDLRRAASLFPASAPAIPEPGVLEELCRRAAGSVAAGGEEPPVPTEPSPLRSVATGRRLRRDIAPTHALRLDDQHRMDDPRGFSHAVCCTHSFSTYVGAWLTWLLVLALIVLFACGAGVILGYDCLREFIAIAIATAGVALVYCIFLWSATCSTCRIHLYTFRRYPRHRDAHHIPLLGYTLTTALTVMFRLRYRCPSCNTPQKLFHKRRPRRH